VRGWTPFGGFLGMGHALFARQTSEPAGLLKKIRLGAIDGAIILRRRNMSPLYASNSRPRESPAS
jgi:hypothetical protein